MTTTSTANLLYSKIKSGNIVTLSKTITLLESKRKDHQELAHQVLEKALPHSGKSIRIGITGIPGVGKSTFLECIGQKFIKKGHKIAILAIDPTSTQTGGSILGDKTRMQQLSVSKRAYIRPSPAGNIVGGVAAKTREAIFLCELAGFDIVFVETLGVGQVELAAHNMVDVFILLALPNAGDELQGIKRGITELADIIVINKCDGNNVSAAKLAANQIKNAMHLFQSENSMPQTEVMLCSALEDSGIVEIINQVFAFKKQSQKNNQWEKRRQTQAVQWFKTVVEAGLQKHFFADNKIQKIYKQLERQVEDKEKGSLAAAEDLLKLYFKRKLQ